MPRRFDPLKELPPRGLARVGVALSLVLGGVVAVGLTALSVVFLVTALRS